MPDAWEGSEPTPLAVLKRIARAFDGVPRYEDIGRALAEMEADVLCALRIAEAAGDGVYVEEGMWHYSVRSGQVHDHPASPGRGWSSTSHRQCEPVYTRRPA